VEQWFTLVGVEIIELKNGVSNFLEYRKVKVNVDYIFHSRFKKY
jgi:hypothetical protein